MNNQDLGAIADSKLEQHFLVSDNKIALIYEAASIRPGDRVVELGAGAGTVTRLAPPCRTLTAVELDERLFESLRSNAPKATILIGDALTIVQNLSFDVLIGNLPGFVTDDLLAMLPRLEFRVAVLAVGDGADTGNISSDFAVSEVTKITGSDFIPPQPSVSRIVKVTRK